MYRFIISEAATEDQFVGNVRAEYVGSSSSKLKSKKFASDNGFSHKTFAWGTIKKLFSCQNLDLSLS